MHSSFLRAFWVKKLRAKRMNHLKEVILWSQMGYLGERFSYDFCFMK